MRQTEPRARARTIWPVLRPEESGASEMNELDPRAGTEPPPRHLLGPLRVDDDRVGGGEAAPEGPVVPADALVRPDVMRGHHEGSAAPDQRPEEGVQPRREQALHVDDVGPRPGQRLPERLHVAEVTGVSGEAAVDLEASRQMRELPLPVREQRHLDAGPGERRAQVPRVVRDAAPAARLDHRGLHGARIVRDEPSERSRRAHAASRADSIAARCRSTGGYLKTSAAIRVRAPRTTAARRMAAEARP